MFILNWLQIHIKVVPWVPRCLIVVRECSVFMEERNGMQHDLGYYFLKLSALCY